MTFGTEEAGQILSRDARGRVLVSRERRESLLVEYDRSGTRRLDVTLTLFSWLTEKGILAMNPAREVKTQKFSRTREENIDGASVEPSADDLREIEAALSNITMQ